MQNNHHHHRKKPQQGLNAHQYNMNKQPETKKELQAYLAHQYAGTKGNAAQQNQQITNGAQVGGVGGEIEYDANGNPIKIKVGEGAPEEVPQRITALFQLPENLRPEVYARIAYAYNEPDTSSTVTPPDIVLPDTVIDLDQPVLVARVMGAVRRLAINSIPNLFLVLYLK